ncbi:MAG: integral rane sensor signal transduction histidine kinase [Acidimicrobiales bacterium]|nr:integral rane sensor signal transduction histidine kinase [Acidimicrobiales bacterium]
MAFPLGSLRGRLVALFVVGLAVVIGGASTAIYVTLSAQLDRSVNDRLTERADDIAATLDLAQPSIGEENGFAVVLTRTGTVITASSTIRKPAAVLSAAELARAATSVVSVDRTVAGLGAEARLIAQPESVGGHNLVVVTGIPLETLVEARQRLLTTLAVGGPLLVLLLGLGAWFVVTAALRPVRRISREAEEISRIDVGRRLPEPATTELAQLSRTLNAMLDRLGESFERERAFVDDASHELRTPIAILRGELELASASHDVEELRGAVVSALEEAVRLADMAEGLLVLARSGVDDSQRPVESIDLAPLVESVAGRLERLDIGAMISVQIVGHGTVRGHRQRLEQIVGNLLANARRHADSRVLIEIAAIADAVTISVGDDGPGFPEAFLDTAFDRFTQADPSRRRSSGAGLGLAIVSALIELQHGAIAASNGPPYGGAVVTVTLPAR